MFKTFQIKHLKNKPKIKLISNRNIIILKVNSSIFLNFAIKKLLRYHNKQFNMINNIIYYNRTLLNNNHK